MIRCEDCGARVEKVDAELTDDGHPSGPNRVVCPDCLEATPEGSLVTDGGTSTISSGRKCPYCGPTARDDDPRCIGAAAEVQR